MSKSNKHQTHLRKDFQTQQQANISIMKKHIVTAQHENRREQYQTRQAIPITQREKCFEHNINPNDNRNIHEIGKMRLRKQNPYLFLMIWITK